MAVVLPALPLENVKEPFVHNDKILAIQRFLKSRGPDYDPVYLDGIYGPLTAAALKRWMVDSNLYDREKETGPDVGVPYVGCTTYLMLGIKPDVISFAEMKRQGYISQSAPDQYSCYKPSETETGKPWYSNPYIWLAVGGGLLLGTVVYILAKRKK